MLRQGVPERVSSSGELRAVKGDYRMSRATRPSPRGMPQMPPISKPAAITALLAIGMVASLAAALVTEFG